MYIWSLSDDNINDTERRSRTHESLSTKQLSSKWTNKNPDNIQ